METNNEIKCETNNDVTTLVGYIAPYELGFDLFDTLIHIEVDCLFVFGDECLRTDWLEASDGRYVNKALYIDLSKKHPWLKWYYRRKLKNILRKYGVKFQ